MRRLLLLLTLAVMCAGCEKEDRFGGFGIWDFANYEVVFTLTDPSTGEDLLDESNPSGLWLADVAVICDDRRYTLSDSDDDLSPAANMPQKLALRRTTAVKEGVRYNALSFGEFSPEDDYHGRSFKVEWGDGTQTDIAFDCYISWSDGVPAVHSRLWVDGREQSSGSWCVDIERTLPTPTFDASYRSTDYSSDGSVVVLQRASQGRGVDIVVMGDAYSDRLVANGAYLRKMREAVEAFFSEEPYRSLRHLFNVYAVNTVSPSEGIHDGGQTALGVGFGEGTIVTGDYDACYDYVWKIDDIAGNYDRINELVVLVVVNEIRWAGTCYMWGPYSMEDGETMLDGDYGRGFSITYSCYIDAADLRYTVVHEAAGHGFAKLADEYFTVGQQIDEESKAYYAYMQPYGYFRNIDLSGDVVSSPWYRYTIDTRYAGTDVGYFEGGAYCSTGVWRSSWQSLMLYTEGGFNAISREAAYRRINRLAYGSSWSFDYEDFVAFDLAHGSLPLAVRSQSSCVPAREPLHHPVMMDRRIGRGL